MHVLILKALKRKLKHKIEDIDNNNNNNRQSKKARKTEKKYIFRVYVHSIQVHKGLADLSRERDRATPYIFTYIKLKEKINTRRYMYIHTYVRVYIENNAAMVTDLLTHLLFLCIVLLPYGFIRMLCM